MLIKVLLFWTYVINIEEVQMELIQRIVRFYVDGFKGMKLGKKLWAIVAIKMFILFVVIKLLFFPNFLETHFKSDKQKSEYILNQLTKGE